ncbi:triphosphoribosyl-dephospho-CoA synthase [Halococcus saccharolyticus]|uniref:Triphosphoribosyl-dephospho-CoA protein n=1 Tax=Halococcus saccharolyticus DSM 5350 TaxID=1227455 RepID=M0MKF2_9EURY|nr:triphosphoribosyl-dephospho-CoA synthase [Halococcus saccharolyticus]EMA46131.1 triphosphoribosyl-dephospho-CoA protein [Halococcus saccharolyticus DSM 5350]
MRTPAENAQLALLLEVTATPKPGNVDRAREYPDLRFEHFMAGAVGANEGLRAAAGDPIGESFERAIEGMADQRGGNTQFGALLLLVPLIRAASDGDGASSGSEELTPERAAHVAEATTVADAAAFYRAFEHVDVAVDDPPADMEALDVRRGADAVPAIEKRGMTLYDVFERSADRDDVAREWVSGFPRTFAAADRIAALDGLVSDRAARVFLELLADEPDTHVVTKYGESTAQEVSAAAATALDGDTDPDALADDLVERGVNPGTTADLVAAGLFVALERGLDV